MTTTVHWIRIVIHVVLFGFTLASEDSIIFGMADANVFRGKRAIGLDRSQMILKRNQSDCPNF